MVSTPEIFEMSPHIELWMIGNMGGGMKDGPHKVTGWVRLHLELEGRRPSISDLIPVYGNGPWSPFGKILFASSEAECSRLLP
jgi:hypothetical protein